MVHLKIEDQNPTKNTCTKKEKQKSEKHETCEYASALNESVNAHRSLLILRCSFPSLIILARGPQREVVPQELHDQRGVLIARIVESVQFLDGCIEGLLG